MADKYNNAFKILDEVQIPQVIQKSTHVYHQYTLKFWFHLKEILLKQYLFENNIPSMIYYPIPLYKQEAFSKYVKTDFRLENTDVLIAENVISLPIHTEIESSNQDYIIEKVISFFK